MPTFYRLVKSNPPAESDFMSYLALRRPVPRNATPAVRRSWEGVSVRSTLLDARALARQYPRIGSFIAQLEIPEGASVRVEKTGAEPTHYDLFGDARDLLAAVVRVLPV